ncbi:inositol monophosphatase family protein [Nocardioides sp. REDSEA-S30_B4]|uniref:inositol monophosphatase family protein n=1 Tax=Nocardioides sp. REDSEA-S30_B4 TaxID=1811552 RepID=UPI000A86EEF3|nr:inositol monophosphatase family protein [Nocardioides sp. REDSEA-S30_B4]
MTNDVEVAISATEAGIAVVRSAYGAALIRHAKAATDFATNADIDAERAILDVITTARPEDAVEAEESGRSGSSTTSRRWLVDPLCGTLNFAAQTPLVAVNVALLRDARTLVAVSADPIGEELFWTDGQHAAVRMSGGDALLQPTSESRLVDINCDGPLDRPFLGPQLIADPAFRAAFGPRVMSTTLALAWVAAGRRAGYLSDGNFVGNVHFAAGIALCRAAGCVVTDLRGGQLEGGRGLIAAADADTHDKLVGLVAPHLERPGPR